ncbi:MAG TPA: FliH/SctL family protein [Solirubrobacteraceae bacterium]|nr:FliH/SctL family protein [Solirubrobacteraceae bacterium]
MGFPPPTPNTTDFDFAPLEPSPVAVAALTHEGDAAAEAAGVLASAYAEADAIRALAHVEGLATGRDAALAELAPAAAALDAAARALRDAAATTAERLEAQAVDLALFLAEKVVGAAVAADPALVVEAVRGALRGLVERERVTVLVHPDDLELVRDAMDGLVATLGGIEHYEVQAERRVARGGAVVRTPDGDVDARLDVKLQRAREVVDAELGKA